MVLPILPALYVPSIQGGGSLYGERYLYLPVLGLAWLVAAGLEAATRNVRRPRMVATAAVAVLALSSFAVIARTRVWKDSLTFWSAAVEQSPRNAQAHDGLCFALYVAHRYPEAIAACDRALALDHRQMTARVNRATALVAMGDASTAAREFDAVLAEQPDDVTVHVNRGLASMMLGQVPDALRRYTRALELAPDNAEAHNNLGVALVRLGRVGEGCAQVREAVRLAPANVEYRANLDVCSR